MALNHSVLMAKHPRFDSEAYAPLSIFTNSIVEVMEPPRSEADWDPDKGVIPATPKVVWRGWAAVTPNVDWRARDRVEARTYVGLHAYRVQLWHIDQNELVPREDWGDREKRVFLKAGLWVRVVKHESDPTRTGLFLVVRNSITDSDWWQPTLLCDMNTYDLKGES